MLFELGSSKVELRRTAAIQIQEVRCVNLPLRRAEEFLQLHPTQSAQEAIRVGESGLAMLQNDRGMII